MYISAERNLTSYFHKCSTFYSQCSGVYLAFLHYMHVCTHTHTHTRIWASQVAIVVKNSPASVGDKRDAGLIPGLGRCFKGGHGNPLQYSCLENPLDRGALWATVHRVTKSQIQLKWLHARVFAYTHTHTHTRNFYTEDIWYQCILTFFILLLIAL